MIQELILATGKNTKGKKITYKIIVETYYAGLVVDNRNLIELMLPEGVTAVSCRNNKLKNLIIPESLRYIGCDKELFNYDAFNSNETNLFADIYY